MPGLKFFCEGLTPEQKLRAKEELGETEEIKTQTMVEIKNLIKREPNFYPCTDDAFLLRFLRVKKFHVQKAFELLKKYYNFKAQHSGIITDFKPSDIKPFLEQGSVLLLENRDHLDGVVGLYQISKIDAKKTTLDDILAAVFVILEIVLLPEANQVIGCCLVADWSGASFSTVTHYASPSFLHKIITVVQDILPLRVRAIHFVNEPYYFNVLLRVICMFLSKKLQKRIHLHGTNLNRLHACVPPEILPQEFGGTQGPMAELSEKFTEQVLTYEDHFIKLNQYGYRTETL